MKKELIQELFKKFEDACYDLDGLECWSGREMQEILGYSDWRNFLNIIQKAATSCKNSGEDISNHFVEVTKMIEIGKGGHIGVPTGRPLADFLPTLLIKAKDFATELTSHNVVDKDLSGDGAITKEHVDNNQEVRNILLKRGVKPENLPSAEDVKKVQRRIDSTEKKILKDIKKDKK
jgi:hypothetical protein